MIQSAVRAVVLALPVATLAGCAAVLGGVAGGVAGSEIEEDDGRFDPLENTDVGEEIYE